MSYKTSTTMALATFLSLPLAAVPVISGTFSFVGGVPIPLPTTTGGTTTVTRVSALNPLENVIGSAPTFGLTAADLNGLPGGPFRRVGALFQDFTGGILGDGISFTASATTFILNTGVTPAYGYFAALDDLSGALPTQFMPLNLTATAQNFQFLLPATGDYRFSFGALRTNPGPGALGTYGTTAVLSNVIGFSTPEIDSATATTPLFFGLALLLLAGSQVNGRRQPSRT